MAENNYYEWLGLAVETCETDIVKLSALVDQKINEWRSNKDQNFKSRASIHEKSMREAIANAEKWKAIYLEYKKSVDQEIEKSLKAVQDGSGISPSNIALIAKSSNVSEGYVEKLAREKGYMITKSDTASAKTKKKVTLDSIVPESSAKNTLESIHKALDALSIKNIAELIKNQINIEISLELVSKEAISGYLDEIRKRWRKVSASGARSQEKSNYEKVCSGMSSFLKKYEISDYIQYLNWREVSKILLEAWQRLNRLSLNVMNDRTFNETVDEIFSVVASRENARSILEDYCESKGISYPKPLPKIVVCPYCHNNFEKSEPIQKNCPSCHKSLIVVCPKCGKAKNLIVDSECDGYDLQLYPLYLKRLTAAENFYNMLAVVDAKSRVNDILKKWPGLPGAKELLKKCDELERQHGKELQDINRLCSENKYIATKAICDRLALIFPQSKTIFEYVYQTVSDANKLFQTALAEKDADKRIKILLDVVSQVSDYTEANRELEKNPIGNISDLTVQSNSDSGNITISWKSQNKAYSVNYHVRRKASSPVASMTDGEEVVVTQELSYGDTDIKEGEIYYYAVYATRGPLSSPIVNIKEPAVYLKPMTASISTANGSANLSWNSQVGMVRVFYSASGEINSIGTGMEWTTVTQTGCVIDKLNNGTLYHFSVFKTIQVGEKIYSTKPYKMTCTPIVSIEPPFISKRMGTVDGEYIIVHENKKDGVKLDFYYSENLVGLSENVTINLADLQKKAKKLSAISHGNGEYVVNMSGLSNMIIYPVIVRTDTATLGNRLSLQYIKSIQIKNATLSGNVLCLDLEQWPQGADSVYVCYNDDVYPEHERDCDKKHIIMKKEYEREGMLYVPGIRQQIYYITIFANKGNDHIPISNYLFDNSIKTKIYYSFSSGLGGVKLKLKNENQGLDRPELKLYINIGSIPLTEVSGSCIMTIPAAMGVKQTESIPVKGTIPRNSYGKLFSTNKGCQLILSGDPKIK